MNGEKILWGFALVSTLDVFLDDLNNPTLWKWLIFLAPILLWTLFQQIVTMLASVLNMLDLTTLFGMIVPS